MAQAELEKPVEDSVPMVDGEVAVGEDLEFQRKWWRFERILWSFFALLLLLALLGVFGRGWLAKTERKTSDGGLDVKYDRIQRTGTPSMVSIQFGPQAIHDGRIQLFVTSSVVKQLGAQRIIPSPLESSVGNDGLTYSFPATQPPGIVEIALQPDGPGIFSFAIRSPGSEPLYAKVLVLP